MKIWLSAVAFLVAGAILFLRGSAQDTQGSKELTAPGGLIPASTTMATAWDIPRNPLTDPTLDSSPLLQQIRWGYRLFTNTQHEASRFSLNGLSCSSCHLNAGQREKSLPLVGIAAVFPEYNKREGRLFSLEDRIVGCFWRSQNAADASNGKTEADTSLPSPTSPEVVALSAYISWISKDTPRGTSIPWRGHNVIPAGEIIPVQKLDPKRGESLFMERCSNCHGVDGQGVEIGDKKAGPLWGPQSWNDGAGAARTYTLAGFICFSMPYINPGSLTSEEAQQIAAFINSKPRPVYSFKDKDYRTVQLPADAVYYSR